jgi:hypothetical protein
MNKSLIDIKQRLIMGLENTTENLLYNNNLEKLNTRNDDI